MHEGHRERMREKVMKNGADSLQPHELLEILLFYAIPRRDTNELAHRLIEKFGSFADVFDADYNELMSVEGMGANAAFLIKLIPDIYRTCELNRKKDILRFDCMSTACEFGIALFRGKTNEVVYAVLLDNSLRKIDCIEIMSGAINSVAFDLRALYRECINKRASAVILYHNHPGGISIPSRDDIEFTYQLESKLADISIVLIEHFVVAENRCSPVLRLQKATSRIYIPGNSIGERMIEDFYGH